MCRARASTSCASSRRCSGLQLKPRAAAGDARPARGKGRPVGARTFDMPSYDTAMAEEIVSKTRRKQEMHALQKLGAELVSLPEGQLEAIDLPEDLQAAVQEARRITSREARRRQLQ